MRMFSSPLVVGCLYMRMFSLYEDFSLKRPSTCLYYEDVFFTPCCGVPLYEDVFHYTWIFLIRGLRCASIMRIFSSPMLWGASRWGRFSVRGRFTHDGLGVPLLEDALFFIFIFFILHWINDVYRYFIFIFFVILYFIYVLYEDVSHTMASACLY